MAVKFETAVSVVRNYVYNSMTPGCVGYIQGLNSPHNVKRFILLDDLVGVEYFIAEKRSNKKFVAKQQTNTADVSPKAKNPILALTTPVKCSDVEEIVITSTYLEGYTNIRALVSLLLCPDVKEIFNRFPRLRYFYVVEQTFDSLAFWDTFRTKIKPEETLNEFFQRAGITCKAIWNTENKEWYKNSYLRDGLSGDNATIYTFDTHLRELFNRIEEKYTKQDEDQRVNEIDKRNNMPKLVGFFVENQKYYSDLVNLFASMSATEVKTCIRLAYNALKISGSGLNPDIFKDIGGIFDRIFEQLTIKEVPTAKIITLDDAKQNLNIVKTILNGVSFSKKLEEYTILCGTLMELCGTFALAANKDKEIKQAVKEEFNVPLEALIQIEAIKNFAENKQHKDIKGALASITPEKLKIYQRVFNLNSLVTLNVNANNIDNFIGCIKYVINFVNNVDNWNLVTATQRDAYYILKHNGFILLDEYNTRLFYRALSKPLSKTDCDYLHDVPVSHRGNLKANMENGVYFYFNNNFEQCELSKELGIGFDSTSLKIMYKEVDDTTVEFYFLLPIPASIYLKLTEVKEKMLLNGLRTAFVDLMKRTGIGFNDIAGRSLVNKFPETVLRITTLKRDFANLKFIMSDILDKKGEFADMNIEVGNLNKLLAGFTPQGPYYFNSSDFGNNSYMVGGGTGSGKTVTCWDIMFQLIMNGIPQIMLDTKRDEGAALMQNIGFLGFTGATDLPLKFYNNRKKCYEEMEGIPQYAIGIDFMYHYYMFKDKWFKEQARKLGLEFKGVLDYLQNSKYRGLIDINYSAFYIDEFESMIKDKQVGAYVKSKAETIASTVRTTGIWRIYSTQSPKQGELGTLLTNISNYFIGKNLNSNIVSSSLQLPYSPDIMDIVNSEAENTGIVEIDKNATSRGLFALYEGKSKPKLLKAIYIPECEHSQSMIDFLNKYCPEQYMNAKRHLWTMVSRMFNTGYLESIGAEHIIDYFEKKGLIENLVDTESSETYMLNNTDTNDEDIIRYKDNSISDVEHLGGDIEVYEEYDGDEDTEIEDFEDTADEMPLYTTPFSQSHINNINSTNNAKQGGFSSHQNLSNDIIGRADSKFDQSKIPADKIVNASVSLGGGIHTFEPKGIFAGIGNSEIFYKQMFSSISNVILGAIKTNYGGLSRVRTLEFIDGNILVNGTLFKLSCNDFDKIKNPAIRREIENNNWADLFDFARLRDLRNLGVLSLGSFEYTLKIKADMGVTKFSQIFSQINNLEKIIIAGEVIDRRDVLQVNENITLMEQTTDRSHQIAKSAMEKTRKIPTKFTSIRNFYSDKNVSKTKKIAYTIGGTAILGVSAYLGATLGALAIPIIVLAQGFKKLK